MRKIRLISTIIIFFSVMVGCVKITDTQSGTVPLNKNGEEKYSSPLKIFIETLLRSTRC